LMKTPFLPSTDKMTHCGVTALQNTKQGQHLTFFYYARCYRTKRWAGCDDEALHSTLGKCTWLCPGRVIMLTCNLLEAAVHGATTNDGPVMPCSANLSPKKENVCLRCLLKTDSHRLCGFHKNKHTQACLE
jgi:hypothetical protein